jgi:hypothetical protein
MCGAYVLIELEDAIVPARRLRRLASTEKSSAMADSHASSNHRQPMGLAHLCSDSPARPVSLQTHSMWIWEWQGLRLTPAALAKALAWRDTDSAVLWLIFAASIAVLCALAKRSFRAGSPFGECHLSCDSRYTNGGMFRIDHGCGRGNGFVADFEVILQKQNCGTVRNVIEESSFCCRSAGCGNHLLCRRQEL